VAHAAMKQQFHWSWCEERACDTCIITHGDWCVGVDRVRDDDTVVVSVWNTQDLQPLELQPGSHEVTTTISHVTRLCDMLRQHADEGE